MLYFRDRDKVVVCSHGLVKRRQKIPKSDIERAQSRCEQFKAARESGGLEVVGA